MGIKKSNELNIEVYPCENTQAVLSQLAKDTKTWKGPPHQNGNKKKKGREDETTPEVGSLSYSVLVLSLNIILSISHITKPHNLFLSRSHNNIISATN